jgi:hypothetical protein
MSDELLESEGYEEVTLRLKWKQLAVLRTVARERDMSVDQVVRTVIDHVLMDDGTSPSPSAADPSDAEAGSRPSDAADAPTGRSFFEVADAASPGSAPSPSQQQPDDESTGDPDSADPSAEPSADASDADASDAGTSGAGTSGAGESSDEDYDEDVPRSKSTWQFNEVMSRLQRLNERAAASTDAGEDEENDEDDAGTSMFDLPDDE